MDTDTDLLIIQSIYRNLMIHPIPDKLSGVDAFLPILDRMRKDGAVVLIKLDGERTKPDDNGPYTALVSGKVLEGEFFRIDADSVEEALVYIIINYAQYKWNMNL